MQNVLLQGKRDGGPFSCVKSFIADAAREPALHRAKVQPISLESRPQHRRTRQIGLQPQLLNNCFGNGKGRIERTKKIQPVDNRQIEKR
jgi:hypothetical protein